MKSINTLNPFEKKKRMKRERRNKIKRNLQIQLSHITRKFTKFKKILFLLTHC